MSHSYYRIVSGRYGEGGNPPRIVIEQVERMGYAPLEWEVAYCACGDWCSVLVARDVDEIVAVEAPHHDHQNW